MSDQNIEPQGGQDFGLDNLPENERNETKEILESLKPEGEEDKPEPKDAPKPEGDKPEGEEDDQEGKDKAEEDGEGKRRDVSLMPAYKHKIAEKNWEKEKSDLEKKIADLESRANPENKPNDDTQKPELPDFDDEVKRLADKLDADPEAVAEILSAAEERAKRTMQPFQLSDQEKAALENLQSFQQQQAIDEENRLFEQDFDKAILPEIKAEYGDDVPDSVVADLKTKLRDIAYKEEYKKIPYLEIYRGKTEFRGVIPPKRKGGLNSQQPNIARLGDKTVKYEELTADQISKLSDEDFDKYSDYMARREKRS